MIGFDLGLTLSLLCMRESKQQEHQLKSLMILLKVKKHQEKDNQPQQKVKSLSSSHRRQTCYINSMHSVIQTKALLKQHSVMSQKLKEL